MRGMSRYHNDFVKDFDNGILLKTCRQMTHTAGSERIWRSALRHAARWVWYPEIIKGPRKDIHLMQSKTGKKNHCFVPAKQNNNCTPPFARRGFGVALPPFTFLSVGSYPIQNKGICLLCDNCLLSD